MATTIARPDGTDPIILPDPARGMGDGREPIGELQRTADGAPVFVLASAPATAMKRRFTLLWRHLPDAVYQPLADRWATEGPGPWQLSVPGHTAVSVLIVELVPIVATVVGFHDVELTAVEL